jgi:hypothetical protein
MTDSQSLDKACALREEGNFREAYALFMFAANLTENLLERAGILLNAATNLTQSDEQERSRNQLKQIRELLGSMNPSAFTSDEQDEFIGVTVGVEIEEAEVLAAEGKIETSGRDQALRFKRMDRLEWFSTKPATIRERSTNWRPARD